MKQKFAWLLTAVLAVLFMFGGDLLMPFGTSPENDLFVATVQAQEAGGAAANGEPAGPPQTLGDYWGTMGITKWPLLGAAIWITAIVIELIFRARAKALCPPDAVSQLSSTLAVGDYVKAWQYCIDNPSPMTRAMSHAIERIPQGKEAVQDTVMEQINFQNSIFRSKNSYLNLNATGDTLLGLLGTISGMISAFNKMAYSGATGDPAKLAGSIGEALLCTWTGLGLAITSLGLFYIFTNRIKIAVTSMQNTIMNLIEEIDFSTVTPDMEIVTAEMKSRLLGGKGGVATAAKGAPRAVAGGAKQTGETAQCPHCQAQIQVGAAKCPSCKAELEWE